MKELPNSSRISLLDGMWFIYNDEINTIKYWCSCFNGKEKIFINDKLIIESRNTKTKSEHIIKDETNNVYKLSIQSINLVKGNFECEFHRNDFIQKKIVTSFIKTNRKFRILILLPTCCLAAYLKIYHNISDLMFLSVFIFSFIVGLFFFPLGRYSVEEFNMT